MSKKNRTAFFHSINGRVTLLLVIMSCFTVFALGVSGWNEEKNDCKMRNITLQNNLKTYTQTADTSLGLLTDNLMFFPLVNEGMITLASEERGMRISNSEHNAAIMQIRNGINKMGIAYPYLENILVYYPGLELCINSKVNEPVTDFVLSDIEQNAGEKGGDNLWKYAPVQSGVYLYQYFYIQNGYIAAWIPVDKLRSHFGLNDFDEEELSIYGIVSADGLVLDGVEQGGKFDLSFLTNQDFTRREIYIGTFLSHADSYVVGQTHAINRGGLFDTGRDYRYLFIIFGIDVLILITAVAGIMYWVREPISFFISEINETRKNTDHRVGRCRSASTEFESMFFEYNRLLDELKDYRIQIYEQQLEQKETKLRYLGQQIQPHFMLNALNTIYNGVYRDPDAVRGIILQLSRYYRYVVNVESDYVQLYQELDHIRNYLEFQKLRLRNRITYEISCPESLGVTPIPPFLLESFVGNCLKYGMNEEDLIDIRISVVQTANFAVKITIRDDGPGFPEESLAALELFNRTREVDEDLGIGIRNSIERLSLIYQDRANFTFYNDNGAVVQLMIHLQDE